jgi:hypothetical protein
MARGFTTSGGELFSEGITAKSSSLTIEDRDSQKSTV